MELAEAAFGPDPSVSARQSCGGMRVLCGIASGCPPPEHSEDDGAGLDAAAPVWILGMSG